LPPVLAQCIPQLFSHEVDAALAADVKGGAGYAGLMYPIGADALDPQALVPVTTLAGVSLDECKAQCEARKYVGCMHAAWVRDDPVDGAAAQTTGECLIVLAARSKAAATLWRSFYGWADATLRLGHVKALAPAAMAVANHVPSDAVNCSDSSAMCVWWHEFDTGDFACLPASDGSNVVTPTQLLKAIEAADVHYPPPLPPPPLPPDPPAPPLPPPPPPYVCALPQAYRLALPIGWQGNASSADVHEWSDIRLGTSQQCYLWGPASGSFWPPFMAHRNVYAPATCPTGAASSTRSIQWDNGFNQPGSGDPIDEEVRPTGPPFRLCTDPDTPRAECCRVRATFAVDATNFYDASTVPCPATCATFRRTGAHTQCVPYLNECQDAALQAQLLTGGGWRNKVFNAEFDPHRSAPAQEMYAWCICDGDPDPPRVSDGRRLQATVEAHGDHLGSDRQCLADAHNFQIQGLDTWEAAGVTVCDYVAATGVPAELASTGWDVSNDADAHELCAALTDSDVDNAKCCLTGRDPEVERTSVYQLGGVSGVDGSMRAKVVGSSRADAAAGFAVGLIDNDALPDMLIGNQLYLNPATSPGDFSAVAPQTVGDGAQFAVVHIDQVDGGEGNDLLVVTETGEKRLYAQVPDYHRQGAVVFEQPVVFGTPDQQTRGFALSQNSGRRIAHAVVEGHQLTGDHMVIKQEGARYRCPNGFFPRCFDPPVPEIPLAVPFIPNNVSVTSWTKPSAGNDYNPGCRGLNLNWVTEHMFDGLVDSYWDPGLAPGTPGGVCNWDNCDTLDKQYYYIVFDLGEEVDVVQFALAAHAQATSPIQNPQTVWWRSCASGEHSSCTSTTAHRYEQDRTGVAAGDFSFADLPQVWRGRYFALEMVRYYAGYEAACPTTFPLPSEIRVGRAGTITDAISIAYDGAFDATTTFYNPQDAACVAGHAILCEPDFMAADRAVELGTQMPIQREDTAAHAHAYASGCSESPHAPTAARGIITLNYADEDRVYLPEACYRSGDGPGHALAYPANRTYSLSTGTARPSTGAVWIGATAEWPNATIAPYQASSSGASSTGTGTDRFCVALYDHVIERQCKAGASCRGTFKPATVSAVVDWTRKGQTGAQSISDNGGTGNACMMNDNRNVQNLDCTGAVIDFCGPNIVHDHDVSTVIDGDARTHWHAEMCETLTDYYHVVFDMGSEVDATEFAMVAEGFNDELQNPPEVYWFACTGPAIANCNIDDSTARAAGKQDRSDDMLGAPFHRMEGTARYFALVVYTCVSNPTRAVCDAQNCACPPSIAEIYVRLADIGTVHGPTCGDGSATALCTEDDYVATRTAAQWACSDVTHRSQVESYLPLELDEEVLVIAGGAGAASAYVGDRAHDAPTPFAQAESAASETVHIAARAPAPMLLQTVCLNDCKGELSGGGMEAIVPDSPVLGSELVGNGQCDDVGPGLEAWSYRGQNVDGQSSPSAQARCPLGHDCQDCGPRFEWVAHPAVRAAIDAYEAEAGGGAAALAPYSRALLLALANRGSRNKIVRVPVKFTQHTPVCSTVCEFSGPSPPPNTPATGVCKDGLPVTGSTSTDEDGDVSWRLLVDGAPSQASFELGQASNGCGGGTDCRNCGPRRPVFEVGLDWSNAAVFDVWSGDSDASHTTGFAWTDVNADGFDDLIETNDGAPNRVHYGTSITQNDLNQNDQPFFASSSSLSSLDDVLGSAQPVHNAASGTRSRGVAVADMDGDGAVDSVVVHNAGGSASCAVRCRQEGRFGYDGFEVAAAHETGADADDVPGAYCWCGPSIRAMVGPPPHPEPPGLPPEVPAPSAPPAAPPSPLPNAPPPAP
jgi:hypothetical protein